MVVAAAILLHLAAHLSPWSAARFREPLPEDGPAFVRNDALVPQVGEGVFRAMLRTAAGSPEERRAAAWEGASDTVGASRWRPVATAVLVAERAAPWAGTQEGAVAGAALVSLCLHVLTALGAMRLATSLGGDPRAALLAGLLAAASPAALAAAAWPARQAAVLATALATLGTLVALRGGVLRLVAGGVILAAAGLAHEAAFGWMLAVPVLRIAAGGGWRSCLLSWPASLVPLVAMVVRSIVLCGAAAPASEVPAAALPGPNMLDGVTGMFATIVSFALPSRSHFADGPFVFSFLGHAIALVAIVAAGAWLARRATHAASAAALAAILALTPLCFVGVAGAAPYQDSSLYLSLPLLAAAAGLAFAEISARGGAVRIAAAAAASLLLGANVAATAARAPSYRTRAGLLALATAEMPASPVVRAWVLSDRAGGGPSGISKIASDVREFARDVSGPNGPRLRADAVASATVSRFLVEYASAANASSLALTEFAYDAAEAAGSAATELRPGSARVWYVLAVLRRKTGDLRGAFAAISRAATLDPDNLGIVQAGADLAVSVGQPRLAADALEQRLEGLDAAARAALPPEFFLLYARALSADGALRVPDPLSDKGLRYRADIAAEVILRIPGPMDIARRKALYDVYLRYGDLLASADRPAMALLAYTRALELTGGDMKQAAAEHGSWLQRRLEQEAAAATERYAAAAKDHPEDVGVAMMDLYVAFCRQTLWKEADEVFAQLATLLGSIPAELRMRRAVERYGALETPEYQGKAEAELREALKMEPALSRARYELARVLEWQGTIQKFEEALELYEEAAREGVAEDWGLDAVLRADVLRDLLRSNRR